MQAGVIEELQEVPQQEQVRQVLNWQDKAVFIKSMGWESEVENCQLIPSPGYVTRVCGTDVEVRRSDVEFLDERGHLNGTVVDQSSAKFTLPRLEAAFAKGQSGFGAYLIQSTDSGDKIVHSIEFVEGDSADGIQLNPIGGVEHDRNATAVGFYLMPDARYGLMVYRDGSIDVFSYDPDQIYWQNSIPFKPDDPQAPITPEGNFFISVVNQTFEHHYFNESEGSLTVLRNGSELAKMDVRRQYRADGTIEAVELVWRD